MQRPRKPFAPEKRQEDKKVSTFQTINQNLRLRKQLEKEENVVFQNI